MGAATRTGARVSRPLAQAPGGELCRFRFRGARARARRARCSSDSPPPGCAISTPPNRKLKTLTGLPVYCSVPRTRALAKNGVGAVNSLAPLNSPPRIPGAGATYRSARPPGAAARPGASAARSPLGGKEREKPCRRSARAHSPPPLRITEGCEAGSGAARKGRGGSGEVEAQSAQLPSLDP